MSNAVAICGVSDWYTDRSVLVTGATGFMGKVLVEKLLRSCPNLDTVYVLVRPKKGQMPAERVQKEIINTELFDTLRKTRPDVLKKITSVKGDITSSELGLSAEDRTALTENVSVVFHSAATVKFDEALKLSVAMNIVGTERLLQLCYQMKKLEAFVHVSTAYCNCHQMEVEEKIYPPPTDLNMLIQCVECVDDEILESMTSRLIRDRPNTYTFTKALAEHLLVGHSSNIPVAIVRPSIVTASWREPVPGWVDNLNGPTGMLVGAGKGVVRSMLCHKEMVADFMPVDAAIGLMVCVAWHTAVVRPATIQVYNCTSGTTNPLKWGDIMVLGREALLQNPFSGVLWYPGGSFKSSRLYNNACCFVLHTIPAYIFDFWAAAIGRKPIMVRVQKKLSKAMSTLEYFTTKEWKFTSDNMYRLWDSLSECDQKVFNFDIRNLNWKDYIANYHLGTRQFIMKESSDTLPSARKHLKMMKMVHFAFHGIILLFLYGMLVCNTSFGNAVSQTLYCILTYILMTFSKLIT